MRAIKNWWSRRALVRHLKLTGFKYSSIEREYPGDWGNLASELYKKDQLRIKFHHHSKPKTIEIVYPNLADTFNEEANSNSFKIALIIVKRIFPSDKPLYFRYWLKPILKTILRIVFGLISVTIFVNMWIYTIEYIQEKNFHLQHFAIPIVLAAIGIFCVLDVTKRLTLRIISIFILLCICLVIFTCLKQKSHLN